MNVLTGHVYSEAHTALHKFAAQSEYAIFDVSGSDLKAGDVVVGHRELDGRLAFYQDVYIVRVQDVTQCWLAYMDGKGFEAPPMSYSRVARAIVIRWDVA